MLQTSLYYCGSGSTGVFPIVGTSDYNTLQCSILPYSLTFLSTSGVVSACLDSEGSCYHLSGGSTLKLKASVSSVACGWTHTLLLSDGSVFVHGKGSQGQLGIPEVTALPEATPLSLPTAIAVGAGFRTSFVVTLQGTYVFGENHKYQLGLGHKNPVRAPQINPHLPPVKKITGGNKHSLACAGCSLYVWGNNSFGQLGIDAQEKTTPEKLQFPEEISNISCGWNHSAVLLGSGKVLTCGKGDLGQQGTGVFENQLRFGCVLEDIEEMESGSEHVVVISKGNEVFSWGWNEHGNLGTGDNTNRAVPTAIGVRASHVYAGGAVTYLI